jgi:transposase-like protein
MSVQSRKSYETDFKVKVVLESFQLNTTLEQIRIKYNVPMSVLNRWRNQFRQNAHLAFEQSVKGKKTLKQEESPDYLKRIIGDLTVENDILKKALSVWD